MAFPRWPNQEYALTESIARIEAGIKKFCISSPTGGGKSRIAEDLCRYAVDERQWPVAVFSNRKLLTMQLARGLNASGIHVGVRASGFESWTDHTAPVQVCSSPTEATRVLKARERAIKNLATEEEAHRDHKLFPAKLVLVDEAHMNAGSRMRAIIQEYRDLYDAHIAGITATPLGIGDLYEELIVAGNTSSLRACGALVAADCYEPMMMDMSKVYKAKQELPSQQEAEKLMQAVWTQHVVGKIYEHWKRLNPDGKPSIGFAPGVKESLGLAHEFWAHGVGAAHISGTGLYVNGKEYKSTAQEDRDEIFAMLKDGRIRAIFNRFVLREAIDLPFVECLMLACPVISLLSFVQMIGRGLRASPSTGKEKCIVIDHCGNIGTLHGSPNMDRDEQWIQYFHEEEDKITKDRIERLRDPANTEPEPITCPQCGKMRRSGTKCEGCGFEHQTSVRYIIQEDGTLVPSSEARMPKRKVKCYPSTAKKWEGCYWRCHNSKKKDFTFTQVRALFIKENFYCPPSNLPLMPKNRDDWTRKTKAVTKDRLIQKGG